MIKISLTFILLSSYIEKFDKYIPDSELHQYMRDRIDI